MGCCVSIAAAGVICDTMASGGVGAGMLACTDEGTKLVACCECVSVEIVSCVGWAASKLEEVSLLPFSVFGMALRRDFASCRSAFSILCVTLSCSSTYMMSSLSSWPSSSGSICCSSSLAIDSCFCSLVIVSDTFV